MTVRFYTGLLATATVFLWVAFFSLIFFINPSTAGLLGVSILNASLLLGLLGTFILARIGLTYIKKRELTLGSSRYYFLSFLTAAFFVLMLYFSHAGIISAQNVIITLIIFTALAFFIGRKSNAK